MIECRLESMPKEWELLDLLQTAIADRLIDAETYILAIHLLDQDDVLEH